MLNSGMEGGLSQSYDALDRVLERAELRWDEPVTPERRPDGRSGVPPPGSPRR